MDFVFEVPRDGLMKWDNHKKMQIARFEQTYPPEIICDRDLGEWSTVDAAVQELIDRGVLRSE